MRHLSGDSALPGKRSERIDGQQAGRHALFVGSGHAARREYGAFGEAGAGGAEELQDPGGGRVLTAFLGVARVPGEQEG